MNFNIKFLVQGPVGIIECENTTNPIKAENLDYVLSELKDKLPHNHALGIKVIGVQIVPVGYDCNFLLPMKDSQNVHSN